MPFAILLKDDVVVSRAVIKSETPLGKGFVLVDEAEYEAAVMGALRQKDGTYLPPVEKPARLARILKRIDFDRLFTMAEDIAIDDATRDTSTPEAITMGKLIRFFHRRLDAAGDVIRMDHPEVAQGLNLLVQAKLLTAERREQILANQPPT